MIPNELSCEFSTAEGRRRLIGLYGNTDTAFVGHNEDGEQVSVSFDTEKGIVLNTYQENGWVRVNYYDKDGYPSGETFDGKWR